MNGITMHFRKRLYEEGEADDQTKSSNTQVPDTTDRKNSLKDSINTAREEINNAKKVYSDTVAMIEKNITQMVEKDTENPSVDNKRAIVSEYNRKRQEKDKLEATIRRAEDNILNLSNQLAALNGEIGTNIVESMEYSYSRNLYESMGNGNKTLAMADIIRKSFTEIDGLSYQPTMVRCKTFAKNIINYINKQKYFDDADQMIDLMGFVHTLIENSTVSLSANEQSKFFDNFVRNLRESDVFKWRFSNGLLGTQDDVKPESGEPVGDEDWVIDEIPPYVMVDVLDHFADDIDAGLLDVKGNTIISKNEDLLNRVSDFINEL